MCGRYAATRRVEDLVEEFEVDDVPGQPLPPDYNVAPTKPVYAVVERAERRRLAVATWGLVPSWAKDPALGARLVNARVETAADKPAFRAAFRHRRCLLPADGYYEWYQPQQASGSSQGPRGRPRKQPFFIHRADGGILALAGLYELWRDPQVVEGHPGGWRWTVTVLTTSASDELGRIHDRMPLLVPRSGYAAWLDPSIDTPDEVRGLLVPATPGLLEAYPVSTLVNDVRHNGAELVEPLR
jgi:putative SOS response-associated peptidase YedK